MCFSILGKQKQMIEYFIINYNYEFFQQHIPSCWGPLNLLIPDINRITLEQPLMLELLPVLTNRLQHESYWRVQLYVAEYDRTHHSVPLQWTSCLAADQTSLPTCPLSPGCMPSVWGSSMYPTINTSTMRYIPSVYQVSISDWGTWLSCVYV